MKSYKKVLSILLAIMIVFSVIPTTGITAFSTGITAFSAEIGDFEYEVLSDGTASITGYDGSSKIVNIPQMIDGYTVTKIGQFAFVNLDITEINMPDSILTVGNIAIYNCTQLTSITFSKNLTSIEVDAITDCVNLHSVTLPKTVQQIDGTALGYVMKESSKPNVMQKYPMDDFVIYGHSGTAAQNYAEKYGFTFIDISDFDTDEPPFIWKCTRDTDTSVSITGYIGKLDDTVALPETVLEYAVTGIGKSAFASCKNLTSITLPGGLTSIGNFAFDGCTALTEIWIPNSVKSLGSGVFNDCEKLATVVIGSGVTELTEDTFRNCYNLKKIVLSDSITNIPDRVLVYGNAVIYGYKGSAAEDYTHTGYGNGYKFYVLPEITDTDDINLYYSIGETAVEEVVFALYINRDIDVNSVSVKDRNGRRITDFEQTVTSGMEFSADLVNGQKFSYKFPNITLGDIDGNGEVDDWDSVLLDRYLAGWDVEVDTSTADIDQNGEVDDWDSVLLARKLAGWDV